MDDSTLAALRSAFAASPANTELLLVLLRAYLDRDDREQARAILDAGLVLYAGASLAGGLAPVPEVLLGARAAQGLGGALVFPATLALVNTTFAEGRERNRALAVWGSAGAAGLGAPVAR